MPDALDRLLDSLLEGPHEPSPEAWHGFGDHGKNTQHCPLFKTHNMCGACCFHFTGDLFEGVKDNAAFDDAYTRFRLTARREVTASVFRNLAAYACRRCPNNPIRTQERDESVG
jgi:hypothetical protein